MEIKTDVNIIDNMNIICLVIVSSGLDKIYKVKLNVLGSNSLNNSGIYIYICNKQKDKLHGMLYA